MADRAGDGRPRYDAIQLQIQTTEGFRSAGEVVAEARDAVMAGHTDTAFDALNDLALQANEAGLPDVALEFLAELRTVMSDRTLSEEQRAWLLNIEGLARLSLGERERAAHLFERMRTAGERLDDDLITSTALQNLGILAVLRREPNQAIEHYKHSLFLKKKIRDYYGLVQVFLNLAVPLLDMGEGERAEQMLHDIEPLIRYARDPDLLGSLNGNLGQIAAKRGQFEIAQRRFRHALQLARSSAAGRQRELIALQNLGSLEMDRGRPQRALRWYRSPSRNANSPSLLHLGSVARACRLAVSREEYRWIRASSQLASIWPL